MGQMSKHQQKIRDRADRVKSRKLRKRRRKRQAKLEALLKAAGIEK